MSAVAGTLGSIIGYLGAEVAETTVIERLLWPQRFYYYINITTFFKLSFLMPMSGPLHRAALQALDEFRDRGLYRGPCQGHMLGTAFYPNRHVISYHRTAESLADRQYSHEVRNCFWIGALKCVDQTKPAVYAQSKDLERGQEASANITRAKQKLFKLHLDTHSSLKKSKAGGKGDMAPEQAIHISENTASVSTFIGIVASELSTILLAVAVALWKRAYWLTAYLCIPLLLKLLSAWFTVRREALKDVVTSRSDKPRQGAQIPPTEGSEESPAPFAETTVRREIFEIVLPDIGFILITAPSSDIVFQFFRHYGHPLRLTRLDRMREVLCIALVYVFVIYFPVGLISLLWMDEDTQYLWLGYQVYVIAAMHAGRLIGLNECATLEERIGKIFEKETAVCLDTSAGSSIFARLETETVKSVARGKERVDEIVYEALEASM